MAGEQSALQRHVVEPRRHRPGDADHASPAQILGHGVAADANHAGDLVPAMAADMFEAKDFSNLTHWQSLAWHGAPQIAAKGCTDRHSLRIGCLTGSVWL